MMHAAAKDEAQVADASNGEALVPMHGDVLETIFSHVPLVDLGPASRVSKSWRLAVISSVTNFNRPKPWLIVHSQSTRAPSSVSVHAYDPRSHVWIEISQPSIQYTSTLRSSHSNLLYMLSPSRFSFTNDPLRFTWNHVDAPSIWRVDSVVAIVNDAIVIAGSTCDFEDDRLAVEMYDFETRTWQSCEPMPMTFKDSATSTWLSTAVSNNKLLVMEKSSSVTHWFDPKSQRWSEPFDLLPDRRTFHSILSLSGDRLILIGLIGTVENLEAVKIYKVNTDEKELYCGEEIGEMPSEFIEKLRSDTFGISSVSVCAAGDLVYLYDAAAVEEEVVVGEVVAGGGSPWRWWSVKNEAGRNQVMERKVFTCVDVGLEKLRRVMSGANRSFTVKRAELTRYSK